MSTPPPSAPRPADGPASAGPYGVPPAGPAPARGYAPPPSGSTAPAPGRGPTTRNVPGLVSLILGAATLLWSFAFVFVQAVAIANTSPSAVGALSVVNLTVQGLLSVAGLVFGVIGLVIRDRPRAIAGIGTGLASAGLVGVAVGLAFPLVMGLAYS
nr:hypothetical protein [Microbacterium lemovicicum]